MKKIAVGILAHVDSGKTTLSEALLYNSGAIKSQGRVDRGDSFLDTEELERKRGITIFSKLARMTVGNTELTLVDTPGHVDFSPEMERTLSVLDYAMLVISGSEGIKSHTETLWRLLRNKQIPTIIFVNKMDLSVYKKDEILERIKAKLGSEIVDFSAGLSDGKLMEDVAVCDEKLLERFLNTGKLTEDEIAGSITERMIFPCFFGSALKDQGVKELLQCIDLITREPLRTCDFGAMVYKIGRDNRGVRLTYLKLTGGSLGVRDTVKTADRDGDICEEKVNQIRLYSGSGFNPADRATAGTICAVTGLSSTYPGQGLGCRQGEGSSCLTPVLTYKIETEDGTPANELYKQLRLLAEEDPTLQPVWIGENEEIQVSLMGEIQMEVLKDLIKSRFGTNVNFGPGTIVYKETIRNTVEGAGHFEPLRHYAEVRLLLEPAEQGSGMTFDTSVSEDDLDRNWQNLILTHLEEKPHLGVLTGSQITDMKITLAAGSAHKKHTEGGDFRQASYRAVRQGLMEAESVLLEPYYDFIIDAPSENMGKIMSDVTRMKGAFSSPEVYEDKGKLLGSGPVSAFAGYQKELLSFTSGSGTMSCSFKGYFPCADQANIVAAIGYDPERDVENTADSVFCQKGAGCNIKWNEAKSMMHTESVLKPKRESRETLRRRAAEYAAAAASDKELTAIFERTFGPIKRRTHNGPTVIKARTHEGADYIGAKTAVQSGPEYLLIDGYNVIHDWDKLRNVMERDFGSARDMLIDILCNYQGFQQCRLILVFDAYKVKGGTGSVEKICGIDVVYTKEAETADMYIEKVTHQIGRKYRVRVVTSDGMEQIIIMGHGAVRTSSSAFEEEVSAVEEAIREYL